MLKVESSTAINIEQVSDQITIREVKGKMPLLAVSPPNIYYYNEEAAVSSSKSGGGYKKRVAVFDFVLRICALTAALAAAVSMGTTEQTLPFFSQFFQFQASYDDISSFQFFVIAMAIATGYLVLSIPFSVACIIRPQVVAPRLLLIIFDTVTVAFTTSAASSAAAIVYLAHEGNSSANWLPICDQFDDFCQRVSGAVVASFISITLLIFVVILSAVALRNQ